MTMRPTLEMRTIIVMSIFPYFDMTIFMHTLTTLFLPLSHSSVIYYNVFMVLTLHLSVTQLEEEQNIIQRWISELSILFVGES